jgi:hypothetical protein
VAYNFQIGKNKMKLLTEYESVIQKASLHIESTLQNVKFRKQFYFVFSSSKIIDHGNSDNNLE